MNVDTTIVKTDDLKTRLEQAGHYWWVAEEVKAWGVLGTIHTEALTLSVYRKCWDWGVIPTRKEVQELLKPLVLAVLEEARLAAEERYRVEITARALALVEDTHDISVLSDLSATFHFLRYFNTIAVNLTITDEQAIAAWKFRQGWFAQADEAGIEYRPARDNE